VGARAKLFAAKPLRILMSAIETPKKILTSEVCFLCKAKVSSEEKIKVFVKTAVAVHMACYPGSSQSCKPIIVEVQFLYLA